MKLPALAIVTAFASGIACDLNPGITHRSSSHAFVAFLFFSAATSLLIGILFLRRSRVVLAGLASLLCWGMLGMAGVCIEEQPRRANHILSLVDAGKINLKSPLRYFGLLADEPEKLPWGAGYSIELSGVDFGGSFLPASAGLRLGDRLEISCFVACPEVSTVTTSKRAEAPNQNQNNQ
jgi:hypothetical protein